MCLDLAGCIACSICSRLTLSSLRLRSLIAQAPLVQPRHNSILKSTYHYPSSTMEGNVRAQLATVAALPDQKAKLEQYKALLNSILSSQSVEACNTFVDHSRCHLAACCMSDMLHVLRHVACCQMMSCNWHVACCHALWNATVLCPPGDLQAGSLFDACSGHIDKWHLIADKTYMCPLQCCLMRCHWSSAGSCCRCLSRTSPSCLQTASRQWLHSKYLHRCI